MPDHRTLIGLHLLTPCDTTLNARPITRPNLNAGVTDVPYWDTHIGDPRGAPVFDVYHSTRLVVLHRAWCREFCRSCPCWAGQDGSRRHDNSANLRRHRCCTAVHGIRGLVSGPAHNPKVVDFNRTPATNENATKAGASAPAFCVSGLAARVVPKMARAWPSDRPRISCFIGVDLGDREEEGRDDRRIPQGP